MKKLNKIIVCTLIILFTTTPIFAAQNAVALVINNIHVQSDNNAYIENNSILVPLRVVSENLGALVKWDGKTQSISIIKDDIIIMITINSTRAVVNSVEKTLATPPIINAKNVTYVPIRFISENLGCDVKYEQNKQAFYTQTVSITENFIPPTDGKIDTSKIVPAGQSFEVETIPTQGFFPDYLIPIYEVSEKLGYKVQWEEKEKSFTLTKDKVAIKLFLNSNKGKFYLYSDNYGIDGDPMTLESNTCIIGRIPYMSWGALFGFGGIETQQVKQGKDGYIMVIN